MRNLHGAMGLMPAGGTVLLDVGSFNGRGFTTGDVRLLQEAHQKGFADRGWGRAQFASNDFSHYLAIWENETANHKAPTHVIVRFWETGTYALMVRGKIVATDTKLRAILPALAAAGSKAEEE
jgi:hypothetical protein